MLKQRTTAVVRFPAGTLLALTKDQARARRHALAAEGGNLYRSTAPVEFKAGEEFGIEGEPPKAIAGVLESGASSGRNRAAKASARAQAGPAAAPLAVHPARLDIA